METYTMGGYWGNTIGWSDWGDRRVVGWKARRPKKGDLLRGHMKSGRVFFFRVTDVEYCSDPSNMFFATVKDIGYEGEVDLEQLEQGGWLHRLLRFLRIVR